MNEQNRNQPSLDDLFRIFGGSVKPEESRESIEDIRKRVLSPEPPKITLKPNEKPIGPRQQPISRLTPEQERQIEIMAEKDREIRKTADPMRRRQPKIIRHMSRRQRIALSQSPNGIRASYTPESRFNATPTLPDKSFTTREVGPNDRFNSSTNFRSGKATIEPTKSNKTGYRGRGGRKSNEAEIDKLLDIFTKDE